MTEEASVARRAALRTKVRPWRYAGLALILLGAGLLLFARSSAAAPDLALIVGSVALAFGWTVLIGVAVVRTRANRR